LNLVGLEGKSSLVLVTMSSRNCEKREGKKNQTGL